MRIALHTRLRAGAEAEYDEAHRHVPPELVARIRAAGATDWTIWRNGSDVFHVLCCEDYANLLAALEPSAVNRAWQQEMSALLEIPHDYGAEGGAATLPVVWDLASETGGHHPAAGTDTVVAAAMPGGSAG